MWAEGELLNLELVELWGSGFMKYQLKTTGFIDLEVPGG